MIEIASIFLVYIFVRDAYFWRRVDSSKHRLTHSKKTNFEKAWKNINQMRQF